MTVIINLSTLVIDLRNIYLLICSVSYGLEIGKSEIMTIEVHLVDHSGSQEPTLIAFNEACAFFT